MSRTTGRHFLQIPGPTNVPDEVLRAMSAPTIDHRGPDFAELGREVLDGARSGLRHHRPGRRLPELGHGCLGGRPGQHPLPRRPRCSPSRPATSRCSGSRWPTALGLEVDLVPGDWRHGVDPDVVEERLTADTGHEIKAVCVVHNETSTGVTSRVAEVRAGHRPRRPPGAAAGRHHLLARLDRLPPRRVGCRRHRERLAEGPDAAAGARLQRGQREGAGRLPHRPAARAPTGTGSRSSRPTSAASGPTRRPPTCSTACGSPCGCSTTRDCRRCSPATSVTPRRPAPRSAPGVWRSCAPTSASTPPC